MADVDPTARGLAVKALQHGATNFPANNAVYVSDYVVGDGVTDDHVAFTAAVTAWLAAGRTKTFFLPGDLIINKPMNFGGNAVTITVPATSAINGRIIFTNGAYIYNPAGQVALIITTTATAGWIGLKLQDFFMLNSGLRLVSHDDINSLYQLEVINLRINSITADVSTNHGLSVEGVYESLFSNIEIDWASTTKSCVNVQTSATGGTTSSNVWEHLVTREGLYGYYQSGYTAGATFLDATFLTSNAEGFYAQSYGSVLIRPHFESCNLVSGNSGLYNDGQITIVAPEWYSDTPSLQKYCHSTYGDVVVVGGSGQSTLAGAKQAYFDGPDGAVVNLDGNPATQTYDRGGGLICISNGMGGPSVLVTGGSAQSITTATTTTLTLGTLAINQTGATLSTNQTTVPAGQYLLEAVYNGRVGSSSAATIVTTLQIYNNTAASVVASNAKTLATPAGINESLYIDVSAVVTLAATSALSLRMVSTVSAGTLALTSDTGTPHSFKLTRIG